MLLKRVDSLLLFVVLLPEALLGQWFVTQVLTVGALRSQPDLVRVLWGLAGVAAGAGVVYVVMFSRTRFGNDTRLLVKDVVPGPLAALISRKGVELCARLLLAAVATALWVRCLTLVF
jgi:hypothetical protein